MFEVALSKKEIQRLHDGAWLAVDSADKITVLGQILNRNKFALSVTLVSLDRSTIDLYRGSKLGYITVA